jgi:hypothetical protein
VVLSPSPGILGFLLTTVQDYEQMLKNLAKEIPKVACRGAATRMAMRGLCFDWSNPSLPFLGLFFPFSYSRKPLLLYLKVS